MDKEKVLSHAKPSKRLKLRKAIKGLRHNLKMLWWRFLVFWGFRVWIKRIYARPRYQYCVFHGCRMRRIARTSTGARYWCKNVSIRII